MKIFRKLVLTGIAGYTVWKFRNLGTWKQVPDDEVIWSWLNIEARDPKHQFAKFYEDAIAGTPIVLEKPNFTNSKENNDRRKVFNKVRGDFSLWKPIHESTKWYRTTMVLNNPFKPSKIHGPYPPFNRGPTSYDLNNIILWGHSKQGPFIILEGNHRWYSRHPWLPYTSEVYVGISPQSYFQHSSVCNKCKP